MVEIRDLARAEHVELEDVETRLDVAADRRVGEIDLVHLEAVRAAALIPEDGKAPPLRGGVREVLFQNKEAVEEPALARPPVVEIDRLDALGLRRRRPQRQQRQSRRHQAAPVDQAVDVHDVRAPLPHLIKCGGGAERSRVQRGNVIRNCEPRPISCVER